MNFTKIAALDNFFWNFNLNLTISSASRFSTAMLSSRILHLFFSDRAIQHWQWKVHYHKMFFENSDISTAVSVPKLDSPFLTIVWTTEIKLQKFLKLSVFQCLPSITAVFFVHTKLFNQNSISNPVSNSSFSNIQF